jgi:hypothetical protein
MRNGILAALLVLFALPAFAADTNHYPDTLMDQTCTDDNNVPAATTPGLVTIGGGRASQPRPAAQTSGTGDGFCDNDSRIAAGAITADKIFGPFQLPSGHANVVMWLDGDAVTGGDTTYGVFILAKKPHEAAIFRLESPAAYTGNGDHMIIWGLSDAAATSYSGISYEEFRSGVMLPQIFYLSIDFVGGGATSITADVSLGLMYRE